MKSFETWWKTRYESVAVISASDYAMAKIAWQAAMEEVGILAQATPADPQHGREPEKVKPLAQYLSEYLDYQGNILPADMDSLRDIFEQALDAYESTEQVKIRIEPI